MNSIFERLEHTIAQKPDAIAFVAQDRQEVTFATLWDFVQSFAEELRLNGVQPGDYVVTNVNHFGLNLILRLASIYIGANIVLATNPSAPIQQGIAVKWIVMEGDDDIRQPGLIPFNNSWFRKPAGFVPFAKNFKVVNASSGSTGTPKFMESGMQAFSTRILRADSGRPKISGTSFVAYGAASGVGFAHPLRALIFGNTLISPMPDPVENLVRMNEYEVKNALIPSQYLAEIVEAAEKTGVKPNALESIWAGGGAISRDYAVRAEQLLGCKVYNTYGSSEAGSIAHGRPALFDVDLGLVGEPDAALRTGFLDTDGQPADSGEIRIFVPKDRRIRKCFGANMPYDADGYLRTGDLGYLRSDGNLVITGRIKNLINAGGNKIAPSVIEAAALQDTGVKEAVAFGITNALGSEDAALGVKVGDDFDMEHFTMALREKFGTRIMLHPFIVKNIPQNAAHKVDITALRELFNRHLI